MINILKSLKGLKIILVRLGHSFTMDGLENLYRGGSRSLRGWKNLGLKN